MPFIAKKWGVLVQEKNREENGLVVVDMKVGREGEMCLESFVASAGNGRNHFIWAACFFCPWFGCL